MPAELITLEPDDIDRYHAAHTSLRACPFCGGHPITMRQVNSVTKNIVAKVACTRCNAHVVYVDKNPSKAREGAIAQWERRV